MLVKISFPNNQSTKVILSPEEFDFKKIVPLFEIPSKLLQLAFEQDPTISNTQQYIEHIEKDNYQLLVHLHRNISNANDGKLLGQTITINNKVNTLIIESPATILDEGCDVFKAYLKLSKLIKLTLKDVSPTSLVFKSLLSNLPDTLKNLDITNSLPLFNSIKTLVGLLAEKKSSPPSLQILKINHDLLSKLPIITDADLESLSSTCDQKRIQLFYNDEFINNSNANDIALNDNQYKKNNL